MLRHFNFPLTAVVLSCLPVPHAQAQTLDSVEITKNLSPAVVLVKGTTEKGDVVGSGFIVSEDGKIVTNLHVIRDLRTGAVRLSSGSEFSSFSVLAFDSQKDLALVKVAGTGLPSVRLGNSDKAQVGEPVLIIGNPLGLQGSVTTGVLSAIRDEPFGGGFKILQTDAAVNPGNSGGPVVNRKQEVVGVVVFRVVGGENLNFAVPINYLRPLLDRGTVALSLDEMRTRLDKTGGASASKPSPPLKTESFTIPSSWYTADPKKVVADPNFPKLSILKRTEILQQIDPKFAKMSPDKRHAYLWNAETDNLPKAPPPKEIVTWNASAPNCSSQVLLGGVIKKVVSASDIQIEATLERDWFFLRSHLKITNKSSEEIPVVPQIFVLHAQKPKRLTLFFEYPNRVAFEIYHRTANVILKYPQVADSGYKVSQKVEPDSMEAGMLLAGYSVEGNVWFEWDRDADEIVLRVPVSDDLAFDIPFSRMKYRQLSLTDVQTQIDDILHGK